MSNTKKIALMSTLVLLLAVTAIFNFVLAGSKNATVDAGGSVSTNYFTSFRSNRTSVRSEEFVQLDSVIASAAPESEEYKAALQRKQELVEIMEDELVMENILKGLGFSDAVGSINGTEYINVFLNTSELTEEMTTQVFAALEVKQPVREGYVIIMPINAES